MNNAVVYIHGKGGNADEAEHYKPLFENCDVIGLEYSSEYPWEAAEEFSRLLAPICETYKSVTLIANSIGAYFAMSSLSGMNIERAFFVSPVVDMKRLIENMMVWAGVSEDELREKGSIETAFGETLSWEYLSYARKQQPDWRVPTHILYGSTDNLTAYETVREFADRSGATLTVMENGEHWFHTEEQMRFLDEWILKNR